MMGVRWRSVLAVGLVVVSGCGSEAAPEGEHHVSGSEAAEHDTAYIAVVVYDPPGDDLAEGGGEHVVIRNNADIRIDMGGWWVEASGGRRLPLGIGRQIDPDAELRVHTGSGTDGDDVVFAGLEEEALGDAGRVVLRDAAGAEVMEVRYPD